MDAAPFTTGKEHRIRRAQPGDVPALAGLLRRIGWFAGVNDEAPEETPARVERALTGCLGDDSHSLYVACGPDGGIAGYVSVHWLPYLFMSGPEGFISELFIDEPARGQGLGAQLLATVEAEARQRGCARLGLVNMRTRESYERGFYAKMGWEERPEAANFVKRL